jgi:hypothetical protein
MLLMLHWKKCFGEAPARVPHYSPSLPTLTTTTTTPLHPLPTSSNSTNHELQPPTQPVLFLPSPPFLLPSPPDLSLTPHSLTQLAHPKLKLLSNPLSSPFHLQHIHIDTYVSRSLFCPHFLQLELRFECLKHVKHKQQLRIVSSQHVLATNNIISIDIHKHNSSSLVRSRARTAAGEQPLGGSWKGKRCWGKACSCC